MRKILIIIGFWTGALYTDSCSFSSNDPATQFAFNACVANFVNDPDVAISGVAAYQATASNQIGTACSWCTKIVQGSSSNSGAMTDDYYDVYSSEYGDLTQIKFESLTAIFNGAGVMNFINQGDPQKQAFSYFYVNQCGVRQAPQSQTTSQCVSQCITLAQWYISWLAQQQLSGQVLQTFISCARARSCWNYGQYGNGCFSSCLVTQSPFKPTAIPWILTQ